MWYTRLFYSIKYFWYSRIYKIMTDNKIGIGIFNILSYIVFV